MNQNNSSTVGEAIVRVHKLLQDKDVDNPRLDARLLLSHVLGVGPERIFSHPETRLTATQFAELERLVARRMAHEPVARIVGTREFWSLNFKVDDSTLVPRPDSETLVEAVLARVPDRNAALRVLDLGTGSGCLLLALLSELKAATGLGIDLSKQALSVARENAEAHDIQGRVRFTQGNWFDGVDERERAPFDLIISNPPYIPDGEIARLDPDVANYDPRTALSGGEDGLQAYRQLFARISEFMTGTSLVALEIGADQAVAVTKIGEAAGLQKEAVCSDIAGRDRVLIFRRPA